MNIEVDVRALVLTGVEAPDPGALGAAVSARLARLVAERGLPHHPPATGPVPGDPDADLPALLAEAIWARLGRWEPRPDPGAVRPGPPHARPGPPQARLDPPQARPGPAEVRR